MPETRDVGGIGWGRTLVALGEGTTKRGRRAGAGGMAVAAGGEMGGREESVIE